MIGDACMVDCDVACLARDRRGAPLQTHPTAIDTLSTSGEQLVAGVHGSRTNIDDVLELPRPRRRRQHKLHNMGKPYVPESDSQCRTWCLPTPAGREKDEGWDAPGGDVILAIRGFACLPAGAARDRDHWNGRAGSAVRLRLWAGVGLCASRWAVDHPWTTHGPLAARGLPPTVNHSRRRTPEDRSREDGGRRTGGRGARVGGWPVIEKPAI